MFERYQTDWTPHLLAWAAGEQLTLRWHSGTLCVERGDRALAALNFPHGFAASFAASGEDQQHRCCVAIAQRLVEHFDADWTGAKAKQIEVSPSVLTAH